MIINTATHSLINSSTQNTSSKFINKNVSIDLADMRHWGARVQDQKGLLRSYEFFFMDFDLSKLNPELARRINEF